MQGFLFFPIPSALKLRMETETLTLIKQQGGVWTLKLNKRNWTCEWITYLWHLLSSYLPSLRPGMLSLLVLKASGEGSMMVFGLHQWWADYRGSFGPKLPYKEVCSVSLFSWRHFEIQFMTSRRYARELHEVHCPVGSDKNQSETKAKGLSQPRKVETPEKLVAAWFLVSVKADLGNG